MGNSPNEVTDKKLAAMLKGGVTADIWYDASAFRDKSAAAKIERVQEAMLEASKRLGSNSSKVRNTTIKVRIVFGEQASRHIADGKVTEEVLDGFNEYEFATQEIADAFLSGVEAASGFLEHYIPEADDLKKIKRKIARQSQLAQS